ncbi:MAG: 30S ribosomal protein S17e [Candidatus Aenigmarchaeota archaeon]|nr:30S ribosomal protein S17e [Candidatus Aenigmarchaeota archaeon]
MGRIRTKWIKNLSKDLISQYPDKFNTDFENNKKVLNELNIIPDKLIRNKVAGYIVTLLKKNVSA